MVKARLITNLDPQAPTAENARIIAKLRVEEVYAWRPYVDDPDCVRELHNLRIAAKRLRYTLEIFADVLPEECSSILKEVTQLQEELGALHDSDVIMALLRLCLGWPDNDIAYEYALVEAPQSPESEHVELNLEMAAYLLDPDVTPTLEQRQDLERLLQDLQQLREEQFTAFHDHWYQLQACNFQGEILTNLDAVL